MDAIRKQRADVPGPAPERGQPGDVRHGRDGEAVRHVHRDRDFGIGYGNSSGYAAHERFVDAHADPLFRLG